jgi:hypothetical protein
MLCATVETHNSTLTTLLDLVDDSCFGDDGELTGETFGMTNGCCFSAESTRNCMIVVVVCRYSVKRRRKRTSRGFYSPFIIPHGIPGNQPDVISITLLCHEIAFCLVIAEVMTSCTPDFLQRGWPVGWDLCLVIKDFLPRKFDPLGERTWVRQRGPTRTSSEPPIKGSDRMLSKLPHNLYIQTLIYSREQY